MGKSGWGRGGIFQGERSMYHVACRDGASAPVSSDHHCQLVITNCAPPPSWILDPPLPARARQGPKRIFNFEPSKTLFLGHLFLP